MGDKPFEMTLTFPDIPSGALVGAARWWLNTSASDFMAAVPKAHEYGGTQGGSADLRLMGDNLAELMGWRDVSDAIKQELAVWFYAQGKAARLVSDYQQQRPGKADTWHDLTVYSMMARRLQESGNWP
jgi:hypothetical protein